MLDIRNVGRMRSRLNRLTLKTELADHRNVRMQTALLAAPDATAPDATAPEVRPSDDGEAKEIRQLRANADFSNYISASLEQRGVTDGAEAELNAALNVPMNRFPMEMLVAGLEERAAINGDSQTNQGSWLDRLFAGSAAEAVGSQFPHRSPRHCELSSHVGWWHRCAAWTYTGCSGQHLHGDRDRNEAEAQRDSWRISARRRFAFAWASGCDPA